jgi:hypothetical protein
VSLESVETPPGFYAERRVRSRVLLRWPLSILKGPRDLRVLSTVTENLSSRGFCCVLEEPLSAGESVACILRLPHARRISQALLCQAHVVWVRVTEDGRFSVGCSIDDYTVVA